MCGIFGIVALHGGPAPGGEPLAAMAEVSRHRGPDDEGAFVENGVAIGMVRLSIIDPEGGRQPIADPSGTLQVVNNGEIYNFRQLRRELERGGRRFRTASDTEVLLHAYAEWGDRFVDRLNGMFAFALWDGRRRRLLLGRDRLGIKPLYYRQEGSRLIFASEAKAILRVPGVSAEIEPAALEQYLALGYAPAPLSMFRGIRKLPPASLLAVADGAVSIRRYWRLPEEIDESLDEREWARALREEMERAVVSQMVSDVPLGAFLSGGIDSSGIVALMARNSSRPVKTYSIGFDTGPGAAHFNELPWARKVAERFGTDHHEILVRPDVVGLLPKLAWQLDEPVADSASLTTFLVAELARREVKVILCGVGGDEIFGGYRRYLGEYYHRFYDRLPRGLRRGVLGPLLRRLPADRHSPLLDFFRLARGFALAADLEFEERYRRYVAVYPPRALPGLLVAPPDGGQDALGRAFAEAGSGDALRTLLDVDLATQLPDDLLHLTDRMTMAASIEGRVPLLDHELVELAARMPSRVKIRGRRLKQVQKRALADLLPGEILRRPKRGFGAPIGAWLKHDLGAFARTLLAEDGIRRRGILRPSAVAETLTLHASNREDCTDRLLALINLELWCRIYLDGASPDELSERIRAATAA